MYVKHKTMVTQAQAFQLFICILHIIYLENSIGVVFMLIMGSYATFQLIQILGRTLL